MHQTRIKNVGFEVLTAVVIDFAILWDTGPYSSMPALSDCPRSTGSGTGSTQPREYN
jgi:hypothetical protein